jgi:hypothetical protein
MVARAVAHSVASSTPPANDPATREAIRRQINAWIRSRHLSDGYAALAAAVPLDLLARPGCTAPPKRHSSRGRHDHE